ncbi:hypothetical protein QBC40DRAFT_274707 [Triangularia verruculosa]|uniref:Mitochondrial inner membrane protein 1 n=1 Tax=Triangularia verruculosa TaxID=2587418 RepID=A0AAN6XN35_9PEZI|nr:hypothetical protein QBC40DRAFT_274707 [Triangularia verruculosa]
MLRGLRPAVGRAQALSVSLRAPPVRSTPPSTSFLKHSSSSSRPQTVAQPRLLPYILRTQYSTKPPVPPTQIDKKHEQEIAQHKLEARPDEVSATSSVRKSIETSQSRPGEDVDFGKDLRNDLHTVKDTFALSSVPREPYLLGLAGTLPYLGTSLATVYLSWNLNTKFPTDSSFLNSFMFSHEAASQWLHILEPIQVGYGVALISFLGAIHWGLEFAEKQASRERTRLRYAVGVAAPLVAWPTTFFPIEWALITQFCAFTALYFVDARAMFRGWAPAWYQTYRFVLTAIVGGALMISLIARTKTAETPSRLSGSELKDILKHEDPSQQYHNWEKEEEKERVRLRKEKEEQEKKAKEEEEKKKKEEAKKSKEKKGDKKDGKKEDKKENKSEEKKENEKDDDKPEEPSKDRAESKEGGNQDKKKDQIGDQDGGNRKNSEKHDS